MDQFGLDGSLDDTPLSVVYLSDCLSDCEMSIFRNHANVAFFHIPGKKGKWIFLFRTLGEIKEMTMEFLDRSL